MSVIEFYGYLNLESTKTVLICILIKNLFYGYLNLESTKTILIIYNLRYWFYGYLNLESTKTLGTVTCSGVSFTVT